MELNISCVRSILLTVEKYETIYEPVSFDEEMHSYYKDYLDFLRYRTDFYIMSNTV